MKTKAKRRLIMNVTEKAILLKKDSAKLASTTLEVRNNALKVIAEAIKANADAVLQPITKIW